MKETVLRSLVGVVGHKRITARDIAVMSGTTDSNTYPSVRKVIRDLIADGTPIGSDHGGFYMITEREEYEDVLEGLQARCDGIQQRIRDITSAYIMLRGSRHVDNSIDIKDRIRFYVIFIAETATIPYQSVWTMAYRKLQKQTKVDLVNLPDWYSGSVLNYVVNKGMAQDLYDVLEGLELVLL